TLLQKTTAQLSVKRAAKVAAFCLFANFIFKFLKFVFSFQRTTRYLVCGLQRYARFLVLQTF
ncbi:hypothetical protein, partial [uncultured Mucilaginibacter sp.]|uniref:hypothetical protein n=1 Tax=uncultured Mucilaginibacter sp. TaxID=797541 RepID=UPI0026391546